MKSSIRISLAVVVLSIACLWIWAKVGNYLDHQPQDSGQVAADMPVEQKLATVDAGHLVSANDPIVSSARELLAKAGEMYGIDQAQAADMAYAASKAAREHGASISAIEVLEAATLVWVKGSAKFEESCAMYVNLRDTMSHAEAIVSLKGLNKSIAAGYASGK